MAVPPKPPQPAPPKPAAKPGVAGAKPKPAPLQYAKPEPKNWLGSVFFWIFVIGAIGTSVWLLHRSPRLHALDCDTSSGMGSMTSFGHCHESTKD